MIGTLRFVVSYRIHGQRGVCVCVAKTAFVHHGHGNDHAKRQAH